MSPAELIVRLGAIRGACPVTLTARTEPAMRKKGNPYVGDLFKHAVVNAMIGWHYATSVNRQRIRESEVGDSNHHPEFKPRKRKWGERVGPFVVHEGLVYLEAKIERTIGHIYKNAAGEVVPESEVKPWLKDRGSCAGHQGVEREIILRDYAIDSITEITFAGTHHVIEHKWTLL
jgi:hypothetical protein